jgi:Transposase DDE domain
MITEFSHPAIIGRTRACPAIVHPGAPLGSRSPPCSRAARSTTHSAATAPASPTGSCSTSSSRSWSSAAGIAASPITPARPPPLRRRRDEWIALGLVDQLHRLALATCHRMLGLDLDHLAVDGCITKAPCGGQVAGPSPVDRRKQGRKRSLATDAQGVPLAALPAPANRRDDGLLAATLEAAAIRTATAIGPLPRTPTVHLDAGYDYQTCRDVLADRGMVGQIATRGRPAPIQPDRRWVIERTHAWSNQYGKLRWCTERRRIVVEFWLRLALALVVVGRLFRRA